MQAAEHKTGNKNARAGNRASLKHVLTPVLIIAFSTVMLSISIGISLEPYTNTTKTCISCHNDTGFPNDTDSNGIAAPYKRPHNDTVMCERCHGTNPHNLTYMQPDGTLGNRTTAVSCPECHQTGVVNFTNAPIIPYPLMHSSDISNGSIWGTYWGSGQPSCIYCHGDTKHDVIALGRIDVLRQDTNNTKSGTLTNTTWCADCHYNESNVNYKGNVLVQGAPNHQLAAVPPLITIKNTNNSRWVNHSGYLTGGYRDNVCKSCHALNGSYAATSLNYSHSLDPGIAGGPDCIRCHDLETGLNAPVGINFTAANASVHAGMNSNNAMIQGYASIIGACWACHDTDGNVTSGHPDRYKMPKNCTDCHLSSGAFYSQSTGWGDLP